MTDETDFSKIPDPIPSSEAFEDSLSTITAITTTFLAGLEGGHSRPNETSPQSRSILPFAQIHLEHLGKSDDFFGLVPLDNALFASYSLSQGVMECMKDLVSLSKAIPADRSRFDYMRQWILAAKENLTQIEDAIDRLDVDVVD